MFKIILGATNVFNAAAVLAICAPFIEQYHYRIGIFVIVGFLILFGAARAHVEKCEKKEQRRLKVLRNFYTKEILQKTSHTQLKKSTGKRCGEAERKNLFERPSLHLLNSNIGREEYEKYLYKLIKSIENQPVNKKECVKGPSENTLYFRKLCLSLLDFLGLMKVDDAKQKNLPSDLIDIIATSEKDKAIQRREKYKNLLSQCKVQPLKECKIETVPIEQLDEFTERSKRVHIEKKSCANWKVLNFLNDSKKSPPKQESAFKLMEKISSVTTSVADDSESEKKMHIDDEIEFLKMFDDWIRDGRPQKSFLKMLDKKQQMGTLRKQHYSMFLVVFFDTVLKAKYERFNKEELEKIKSDFFQYLERQEYIGSITYEERRDLEDHFFYMLARKQNCFGSEEYPYWCKETLQVSSSTKLFQDVLELLDYLSNRDSKESIRKSSATILKKESVKKISDEKHIEEDAMKHKGIQCSVNRTRKVKNSTASMNTKKMKRSLSKKLLNFILALFTFWLDPFILRPVTKPSTSGVDSTEEESEKHSRKSKEFVKENMITTSGTTIVKKASKEINVRRSVSAIPVASKSQIKIDKPPADGEDTFTRDHGMGDCPAYVEQKRIEECRKVRNVKRKVSKCRKLERSKSEMRERLDDFRDEQDDDHRRYSNRISDLWKTMATIIEQDIEYDFESSEEEQDSRENSFLDRKSSDMLKK